MDSATKKMSQVQDLLMTIFKIKVVSISRWYYYYFFDIFGVTNET